MTCPACNATLAPGAYCDGNGTHPLRRAKRLSREEAAEARRLAAERERARHAARAAEADRKERRRGLENPLRRRWQAQRGLLAAELSVAVDEGLATQEEADAWSAKTAGRLAKERAEQESRDAEAVGEGEPDGEEVARRMNAKAGWVDARPKPETPRETSEPRRRSSHRRAIGIVALAGALMGMGGLGNDRR